jgi:hypothetical protein
VLEAVVLSVQEGLNGAHGKRDCDPVFGGAVGGRNDVVGLQPLEDKGECLVGRLDEVVDIILTKMLAIAGVVGVRDCACQYILSR